jgi:hypothetical protein
MNSRVIYSVMFFVLLLILLYTSKSSIMFEKDGEIKKFGLGSDQTLFSFGIFTIVLAIASFYLFCIIDLIFGSTKSPQYSSHYNTQTPSQQTHYNTQTPSSQQTPQYITQTPQYITQTQSPQYMIQKPVVPQQQQPIRYMESDIYKSF